MCSMLFGYPNYGYSDIAIVFENQKKVIYKSNDTNTPLNLCNIFNPEYNMDEIEVYTVTADDYQNASNCNGNCY